MKKRVIAVVIAIATILLQATSVFANDIGTNAIPVYALEQEIVYASNFSVETELPAKSAILIEQSTGKVLFEKDADLQLPPASVTKIMSLLLIVEALERGQIALDDIVTCSLNAAEYGGSQIWLEPGEEMSVGDLLKAVAVASANDATVALAEYISGSEQAFVDSMNKRAKELAMNNTYFAGATGLDIDGHVTTARDIALMSAELMKHDAIQEYTTIWMDSLRGGETELVNTNRLVRFYDDITGLKTGTTDGAGSCLSATAERDGLGLIAVVMGCPTSDERFASARALLDYGFANYGFTEIVVPELPLLPVEGGVEKELAPTALPPQGILLEKAQQGNITQALEFTENLVAPIQEGQEIGRVKIMLDGVAISEYPLIASSAVEELTTLKSFFILLQDMFTLSTA